MNVYINIYIYILALAPSDSWMGVEWILSLAGSSLHVSITNSFANLIANAIMGSDSIVEPGRAWSWPGPGMWHGLCLGFA